MRMLVNSKGMTLWLNFRECGRSWDFQPGYPAWSISGQTFPLVLNCMVLGAAWLAAQRWLQRTQGWHPVSSPSHFPGIKTWWKGDLRPRSRLFWLCCSEGSWLISIFELSWLFPPCSWLLPLLAALLIQCWAPAGLTLSRYNIWIQSVIPKPQPWHQMHQERVSGKKKKTQQTTTTKTLFPNFQRSKRTETEETVSFYKHSGEIKRPFYCESFPTQSAVEIRVYWAPTHSLLAAQCKESLWSSPTQYRAPWILLKSIPGILLCFQ